MILFLRKDPLLRLSPSLEVEPATQEGVRSLEESVSVHQRYVLISAKMIKRRRSAFRRRLEERNVAIAQELDEDLRKEERRRDEGV